MIDEHSDQISNGIANSNSDDGSEPTRASNIVSRRGVLSALGAGIALGTFSPAGIGAASEEERRKYFECSRVRITSRTFPDDVQAEIDQALESGAYESDEPLLLPEAMDIEESYVLANGSTYTPIVERTDDGTYVLTLEEVENPTLPNPQDLPIRNRSEEDRTLAVRITDSNSNDDVVFEETITVVAGERRDIWEMDVIGTYDLTIETDDGQRVEGEVSISESSFTQLEIEEDGTVSVLQAVAGIEPCRFTPDDYSEPWVDVVLESDRILPGERTDAALQLAFTEEGLSEYDLEVTVADPDVARIIDAEYDEAFDAAADPEIADDGSSVTLEAVDPDGDVPTEDLAVPLATVELEAADDVDTGEAIETSLEVAVESMIDDDGSTVDAGDEPATLTVENRSVDEKVGAGIDQYAYSRDSRGLGQGERDSPRVTIGDDTVVVHGSSTTGPSVCSGEELRELAFDEADGTLAVTVSGPNDPDYEPQGCTADEAPVSYELVAVLEEGAPETVTLTERAYARSGTVTVDRDRDDDNPAVSGVEDVEFGLVDDRDIHDAENDPEVTIDGGTVVVSGTIELSAIACQTVEPALIAYDEEWGRLVVEVTDTLAEGVDPDDPCPGAAGAQGYELRVPVDVDSLSRVSVVEPIVSGDRLVTVDGGDLEETTSEIELNGYTPQDLDGDGLYRDVDGNGDVGTNDVVVFFEHLEEPAVVENPEAFDFAETGEVTTADVVALFESL